MPSVPLLCAGVCLVCLASAPLKSQQTGDPRDDRSDIEIGTNSGTIDGEIVVQGERLRGQLDVEQTPLLELNENDIAGEGVTSIADLVTQIGNQTGSARGRGGGRPIILVNGIRIGSFRELSAYPPEALARVEVFPEEVAQRFGFSPDRRVVNLILKENYSSREVELEFEGPSRDGYVALEQEAGYLQIADGGRFNLNFEVRDVSLLTEAERGVMQTEDSISPVVDDPDQAQFRSLVDDSLTIEGSVSWAKALVDSGTSMSANINYVRDENRSLSGLNTVRLTDDPMQPGTLRTFGENDPLERRTVTDTYSASGSLTRPLGAFRLTATLDGTVADSETEVDRRFDTQPFRDAALAGTLALDGPLPRAADAGSDVASTLTWSGDSKVTLRGPLAELPGGEVTSTFDVELDWKRIESADTRTDIETRLTRRRLSGSTNLVIPITSRRNGFADALGSFTLNAQGRFEDLSDFGTLYSHTLGLTWSPFGNLDLSVTYIDREVAPSLTSLGAAQITTFNSPVFDFTTGDTVLATVISGGNPELVAETQRDWRFAANWELPFWRRTRLSAEYIRNQSDDVTSDFPVLTAEIETAFPDRVIRDTGGQLIEFDRRPVTFAETRSERLQLTFSTRGSWGRARPGQGRGPVGRVSKGGGTPRNPITSGFGRDGTGRYFFNLVHTVELENTILIAPGIVPLDLLNGDAVGAFGQARHTTRIEAGVFRNGLGLRLSGRYTGNAQIDGSGSPGSADLFFDELATVDLRMFADIGRIAGRQDGFLKNLRVALRADNVFDGRRRVTDASGQIPINYQPFIIDPTGRFVGIDLRKLF